MVDVARPAQLDLDLQLCFPLYAASRAVIRAYTPLLEPHGLTYPQYLVLLALWTHEAPMSVGALGERLRLDSGTLTPVLKRLEAAGRVARRRDPDDERRVVISLTPAGEALRDEVAGVPGAIVGKLGLTLDDAVALRGLLDRVLHHLDASG